MIEGLERKSSDVALASTERIDLDEQLSSFICGTRSLTGSTNDFVAAWEEVPCEWEGDATVIRLGELVAAELSVEVGQAACSFAGTAAC